MPQPFPSAVSSVISQPAPPSFVTNPQPYSGSDPIGRAIANVLSLGYAAHPSTWGGTVRSDLGQFDPRHPAGAANLAGILMGKLTPEQASFLESIKQTSRGQSTPVTITPEVQALAGHIGAPIVEEPLGPGGASYAHPGLSRGRPQWIPAEHQMGYRGGIADIGLTPGTNIPEVLTGELHRSFLQRLFGRYSKPSQADVQNSFGGLLNDPAAMKAFLNALVQHRTQDTS